MTRPTVERAFPDIETVEAAVLGHFRLVHGPGWRITVPTTAMRRTWSAMYFLQMENDKQTRRQVVKIHCFDHQPEASTSWESEQLRRRCKAEHDSYAAIASHLSGHDREEAAFIRTECYLPEINAIVTDYCRMTTFHSLCFKRLRWVSGTLSGQNARWARKAGVLLSCLHDMTAASLNRELKIVSAQDHLHESLIAVETLTRLCGKFPATETYEKAISLLRGTEYSQRVPVHSDFNMSNVAFTHDGRPLVIDADLGLMDSPYFDVATFTVHALTMNIRLFSLGLLPPRQLISGMVENFLQGYAQGRPCDQSMIWYFEGHILLRHWAQTLESVALGSFDLHGLRNPELTRFLADSLYRNLLRDWERRRPT